MPAYRVQSSIQTTDSFSFRLNNYTLQIFMKFKKGVENLTFNTNSLRKNFEKKIIVKNETKLNA